MTEPVGGIDPHQDTFTVGIVDHHGVEITHDTFPNTATGYGAAIDLLDAHGVRRVGVEGSAKWGAHVAVALCAAGFDAREVPASRSAAQRRSRRPGQDRRRRRRRVGPRAAGRADAGAGPGSGGLRPCRRGDRGGARTPQNPCGCSHFDAPPRRRPDQPSCPPRYATSPPRPARSKPGCAASKRSTPPNARPQQAGTGSNGSRTSSAKTALRAARSADWNGSSTTCSTPTAPPGATSQASAPSQPPPCCARSATRPGSTASPSSPAGAGAGAVALSKGEGNGDPDWHRLDFTGNRRINSVLHIASVNPQRTQPEAIAYLARKAGEGKTRREARRAHKRQLANRVIRRMWRDETARKQPFALAA